MKTILILVTLFTLSTGLSASTEAANKKVVEAFYQLAFNQHKPAEAMKLHAGAKYVQHNPFAGDGKEPFMRYFTEYYKKHPEASVKIKRLIAEGDLVVVHSHSLQNKLDRGSAVVDIFRLQDGKIVEHWDVVQPIPEKSANENTMF